MVAFLYLFIYLLLKIIGYIHLVVCNLSLCLVIKNQNYELQTMDH